jgi:glycosyltransferase involved in cell wall biosynthesis
MPDPVLVSVVIPTFNREAYLRDAIRSVSVQTYEAWELIVVDDGSTDGTRRYVEGLPDPRVRLIASEPTGNPGRACNLGLAAARGYYVAFLDSDDWWEPEKLALQVEALSTHPGCEWCYTGRRTVADGGEVTLFDSRGLVPYDGWILERLALGDATIIRSTVMAERALLERVGGFDAAFEAAEDSDLWLRLATLSPIAVVPRILATRRAHAGSYSATTATFRGLNEAFGRMIARTPSSHIRGLLRRKRHIWLLRLAEEERRARNYAAAGKALAAALPYGITSPGWWTAALKTLAQVERMDRIP